MRAVKYSMVRVGGQMAGVIATVEDRFGRYRICYSRVRGWRRELALKHLKLDTQGWNDDAERTYVGIEALKCARDEGEALKFLETVKGLDRLEVHFWTTKFLNGNKRARRAWRVLYG